MESTVDVKTSDFAIGHAPQVLTTFGVGSCVAICLYHKQRQVGALAHIMLPRAEGEMLNPLRFADSAMNVVIEKLENMEIIKTELVAKLVGGAQMFAAPGLTGDIGSRNVTEARNMLKAIGIPLEAEDVGGSLGRNVTFNLATGMVTIYTQER